MNELFLLLLPVRRRRGRCNSWYFLFCSSSKQLVHCGKVNYRANHLISSSLCDVNDAEVSLRTNHSFQ